MERLYVQYAHQGLSVSDMDASIAWYGKVFDAVVESDENSADFGAPLNCRVVHMTAAGGAHWELFQYLGEEMVPVPARSRDSVTDLQINGNKHCCYALDIPRFVRERVIPYDIYVDHGPERQGANWQMFIRDPDGILFELHDYGGAEREPHAFDDYPCKLFD